MNIPKPNQFIPLNGRLAIELVKESESDERSIWRIIAMASNANLEHYKSLKVGDLIITSHSVYRAKPGTVTYIKPGDILAIYPAA